MNNDAHLIYMLAKHTQKKIPTLIQNQDENWPKKALLNPSKHSNNSFNILHFTKREMTFVNTDLGQNKKTLENR